MATKLTRQTFIQFGINVNASADICQFGSPATGTPVYTSVIATLQALAAWTTGWAAETVANNRPFLEDMNAVHYVFSYMIAYILQMGIAEWDAGTNYYTNSIVQSGGVLYQSLIDNNLNVTPVVGVSWKLAVPVYRNLTALVTSFSANTVYQNTNGYSILVTWNGSGNIVSGWGEVNQYGLIGPTSSPGTLIGGHQGFSIPGSGIIGGVSGEFIVPNNYYFVVRNDGGPVNGTVGNMGTITAYLINT